ncbi:MAG: hypothetical protein WDN76_06030 [Alphaproteobacteria bacterium]
MKRSGYCSTPRRPLDIKGIPLVGKRHTNLQAIHGEGVSGLRIAAPPEILVTAKADGPTWTFILSERAAPPESVRAGWPAGERSGRLETGC